MSVFYIVQFSLLFLSQIIAPAQTFNYYDICKKSGHKIYLEFEKNGTLEAKYLMNNVTQNKNIKQDCSWEIVTCPSCAIFINFSYLNLSNECNDTKKSNINCDCEYIQIYERPYEEYSLKKFCGKDENNFNMKTLTRNLVIQLFYIFNNDLAFTAEYKSIRNQELLTENNKSKTQNYLLSPFFPSYYTTDLITEYVINCAELENEKCTVRLIFTDFQLATESLMEFFDWNGQRLDVVTGIHFRPPILLSTGPSLVVRFYANGGTGLGFKAEYAFDQNNGNNSKYITDCGGYVNNFGGGITMMDMVQTGVKKFDCFWIIKPKNNQYIHFKSLLYLKVANFTDMEEQTELIVHEGTTSTGRVLEVLRYSNQEIYPINLREHIQLLDAGFYVRLKGSFNIKSQLAIVYSAFSYGECFSGADFLCENHRCISRQLACDGFDHCGDGSDEPISCFKDANLEPTDRRWYTRRPNYFFPKIDQYSDLKTATLIFIISSLGMSILEYLACIGLISLVSTLFVLLYRINHRARHDRELQNHLQIITDLLEEEIIDTDSMTDEPPIYEAPPDYDEVIKIFDSASSDASKPARIKRKKKKNKSVKSHKVSKKEINPEPTINQNINLNFDLPEETNENKNSQISTKVIFKRHFRNKFSDEAISTNVKLTLKRNCHSLGELNIKKELETMNQKEKPIIKTHSLIPKEKLSKIFTRETASDSELLNIDADDDGEYKNVLYYSFASETGTLDERGLFDYFKKKPICQCEGACGCATFQNVSKKYSRKFNKKMCKKKQSKFYTR